MMKTLARLLPVTVALGALTAPALADPCGLVPPKGIPGPLTETLTRKGVQYTYVFFKDGVQDVVLRPAFEGKVSEFGMLIPFKTPPAIRKVSDDIFGQLEAAVNPPTITHQLNPPRFPSGPTGPSSGAPTRSAQKGGKKKDELAFDTVRVLNQEAMGMYEVAVLEAGSAQALKRWMTDHGYVYPNGMEGVVQEYVAKRWCFVAVKARVGQKAGVAPRPGMRSTSPALPAGATFKGAVQAMGFRFRTDEPVVPMRLSAHNPGKLHNRCFILADQGVRFEQLQRGFVKKQIDGPLLVVHLTKALPCNLTYWHKPKSTGQGPDGPPWGSSKTLQLGQGEEPDLPAELVKRYQAWAERGRDPYLVNGFAKDLFLSDLLSAGTGRLLHHFEARHKELTNISVALGQRGPHSDQIVEHALAEVRNAALRGMTEELAKMTLTVIEGDFPRETLRDHDLTLLCFDPATGKDSPGPRAEVGGGKAEPAAAGNGGGVSGDPMRVLWDRDAKPELRGKALLAIVDRGDGSDWIRLGRVARDAKEAPLVRFWSVGAMGKLKPGNTVAFLLAGAPGVPVTETSWRWGSGPAQKAQPELHRALTGYLRVDIGQRAPQHLLHALLQGENDSIRRVAASYFADTAPARAVLAQALAFDAKQAKKEGVPWKGGALFLPGISFTTDEAAGIVKELLHWMLYVEQWPGAGGPNGIRVLQNNIFSLGRRYRVMNVNWRSSAADMVIAFSQAWAAKGRGLACAELLVHAYEVGGNRKAQLRQEMTRLAGRDHGASAGAWKEWLDEVRAKQK